MTPAAKTVEENDAATLETDGEPRPHGKRRFSPLLLVVAGVSALALIQAAAAVHAAFAASPVLGALYAAIAVLIVCALCSAIAAEFFLLLRLKEAEALRARASAAVKGEDLPGLVHICQSLAVNARAGTQAAYADWRREIDRCGTAKEVLMRYSDLVLAHADEEAKKIITGHSLKAAALVAISPLALGDMLLVLINSRRMLDRIAECYGIRLGFTSRIKLYRQILHNMVIAAGADVLLGGISTGIAGAILPKVGEALLAGFSSARLGINAAYICRPLPMQDGEEKLGYADICGQIKDSFMKNKLIGTQ